jgi:glycosyltransferase involved in cell wall biosynthesis
LAESKICCLIPAYNEAGSISSVIKKAREYIRDVIVVDDGSMDATAELAEEAGAYVLRHDKNRGKGQALRTGFSHAKKMACHAVLTLDADGQHDPTEIREFLTAYRNNTGDILIGTRLWNRAAIPRYRYIPNQIGIFCISKAAGCRFEDTQSGFRLYRKEVLDHIHLETSGFETETEILIKAGKKGFRMQHIPVSAIYHDDYKTNFRPVRDFYRISILVLKLAFSGGD